MRLLAHITYFDKNETKGVSGKTSALKTSAFWRDFNFKAVVRLLEEMESTYDAFKRVDVVVDVNEEHSYRDRLLDWRGARHASSREASSSRVRIAIAAHRLTHPFQLAWKHREHMAASLDRYDWFLSAEADTLVTGRAMATQVALAPMLYERHTMLLGFTRVVNDTQGRCFFSDIVKSASRKSAFTLDGLGTFVEPTNTYAAVWAYPRSVMKGFVASGDWNPRLRSTRGMRERAAWGWRHARIVTLVDDGALRIFHLGKSGPFLVVERGHNAWPAEKLVA